MRKFIIILHEWFGGSSHGFTVKQIQAKNKDKALNQAKILAHDSYHTFNEVSFKVVELAENMRLRKLTWKERLTGQLQLN